MSDSKLLPDLKGSAVYLCKAANVLFYSLVTARMERDRSTGTLSAAVAPQWQTAGPGTAIILHARDPQLSENETGFMAAGKDVKVKTKSTQPPWQTEREIKAGPLKQRLPWWCGTEHWQWSETKRCFFCLCILTEPRASVGLCESRQQKSDFSLSSPWELISILVNNFAKKADSLWSRAFFWLKRVAQGCLTMRMHSGTGRWLP